MVANWHFVAEILKKNVETVRAPSHVKNGMFNVKKRKYGKRTIKTKWDLLNNNCRDDACIVSGKEQNKK